MIMPFSPTVDAVCVFRLLVIAWKVLLVFPLHCKFIVCLVGFFPKSKRSLISWIQTLKPWAGNLLCFSGLFLGFFCWISAMGIMLRAESFRLLQ